MIQTKAGADVNPVPALRFLAPAAQDGALAPVIALANVPSVHLDDHLVGFQSQFQLRLLGGGLLVQLRAQPLGALALAAGFPIQGGAGKLDAREAFEHDAGLLHGHFASQQCRHFLHGRRVASGFFQAQRGIGGHAPFATAFAVAARAVDGDSAKTRVEGARVIGGEAAEFLLADRAQGRGVIRLGLRAALHGLTQQALDILSGLHFKMPKVLIAGGGESLDRMFQPTSRTGRKHRERFGRSSTLDGRIDRLKTCCIHAPSLHYLARN